MKKILWFLLGLGLAAGLAFVVWNTWQTTAYFQANGRAGTVKIGAKYNASLWSEPLPIKKIHTYVAVLAPDHQLLLETDQNLTANEERFVRYLLRDTAAVARKKSIRPLAGTLRIKSAADGTPVRLADTDLFDRIVDKALGPPAEGTYVRPRATAEAAPTRTAPNVPFVFAGTHDSTLEIIWNNSSVGEWILAGFWLLAIKMVILHAWVTPFDPSRRVGAERTDFVHPTLRKLDADAPVTPSVKLSYVPKPIDHDYLQVAKPSPVASPPNPPLPASAPTSTPAADPKPKSIPLPASAKSPPPKPAEPYSTATTSPFIPAADAPEPTLKLARKPKPPEPPAPSAPSA